jgi:hypothetical protein
LTALFRIQDTLSCPEVVDNFLPLKSSFAHSFLLFAAAAFAGLLSCC